MRLTFLDPGRLTARLDLEQSASAADGQGGETHVWEPVASLWCLVEPIFPRPGEEAGRETAPLTHRVTLRAREGLVRGMRFSFRGRHLLIRAVHDLDMRGAYLVCHCEEETP